ncbi:hypothetical protein ACVU7I_19275, partial [Patulibacter sp. S7RM1-6]
MNRDISNEPPNPTWGTYVAVPQPTAPPATPPSASPAGPPVSWGTDPAAPANAVEHLLQVAERLGRELASTQLALRELVGHLATLDPAAGGPALGSA